MILTDGHSFGITKKGGALQAICVRHGSCAFSSCTTATCGACFHGKGLSPYIVCIIPAGLAPFHLAKSLPNRCCLTFVLTSNMNMCCCCHQGGLVVNATGSYRPALRITGISPGLLLHLDDFEVRLVVIYRKAAQIRGVNTWLTLDGASRVLSAGL
jgi:hypothetical protein